MVSLPLLKCVRALSLVSVMWMVLSPEPAWALLAQTQRDLQVAEDRLRYEFSESRDRNQALTPILVATPQAYWEESKSDFSAAVNEAVARVFPESGSLIACPDCFQNRVFVSRDNRMVVQNGEISLTDLARMRERPGFSQAKSLLLSRETPSGVQLQLIALDDGRILYSGLSDATQTLDDAKRPMGLARELERRKRGESLSYMFFDLGLYPNGLVQFKWLEQWGNRNQHLSGFVLGAYNPTGAVGITYQYMLPFRRQITLGATAFYKLAGVFDAGTADLGSNLLGQGSIQYAVSGSYGFFLSADSQGVFTGGITLMNPVFLPFLL